MSFVGQLSLCDLFHHHYYFRLFSHSLSNILLKLIIYNLYILAIPSEKFVAMVLRSFIGLPAVFFVKRVLGYVMGARLIY